MFYMYFGVRFYVYIWANTMWGQGGQVKFLSCLFDLSLYVPSTIFQLNRDRSSWVEPVLSCVLLMHHKAVTPVRLEPSAPQSRVKHSTTEPLRSHFWAVKYLKCHSRLCNGVQENWIFKLCPAEPGITLFWKHCRSRSAGFSWSHLIRIHTVFHS